MRFAPPSIVVVLTATLPAPVFAQGLPWDGGPIIICGTDSDAHNTDIDDFSFDPTYPDNWVGALFIQQGFNYIRRHLDFDELCGREIVVCLGCRGTGEEVFNAAFDASLLNTQFGWQRVTIVGDSGANSIAAFFDDPQSTSPIHLADVGVIYVPSFFSILPAEVDVLALQANRQKIADFVELDKGGLFTLATRKGDDLADTEKGFDWLTESNGLLFGMKTAVPTVPGYAITAEGRERENGTGTFFPT